MDLCDVHHALRELYSSACSSYVLSFGSFLFRRDPLLNMRENMLFMLGLTVINILTDLGIMSYFMSWVAFGALLLWSLLGGGRGD